MAIISSNDKMCQDICEALGLKHVRKLDIHMAVDEIVTIRAEYYPEKDGIMCLPSILKDFALIRKPNYFSPLYRVGMWLIDKSTEKKECHK